jgi:hypothetical protein
MINTYARSEIVFGILDKQDLLQSQMCRANDDYYGGGGCNLQM